MGLSIDLIWNTLRTETNPIYIYGISGIQFSMTSLTNRTSCIVTAIVV